MRNRLRILGLKDADMTALQQKGVINAETMINAPLSGTIIQRKIGPGQYVATGGTDPSYVIGDLSLVWLVAQLREPDAAKVSLGERLQFRVLAYPDRVFEARVNFIGTSVDPATRRIVVRGEIDNSNNLLKPEMYATVRIINEYENVSPCLRPLRSAWRGAAAGWAHTCTTGTRLARKRRQHCRSRYGTRS
ncbi:hypothetical protein OCOJLMKI_3065 [Methylobacterium iners]|uniref:CusB-like beta-barrel domain-containing protein n=1 Tax=Methylobacterium iners TaxID=418707 RepID=A0ABQ4S1P9_9HYPH|nr:hypothetical protein OCOJLMKI_3065 [Methylobacterium iners]